MAEVTTARNLADKALHRSCGGACVEWAVSMLLAGFETDAIAMLAAESPPYHHFEVAALRDQALAEIGAPDLDPDQAIEVFAAERFHEALTGHGNLYEALRDVKDLYLAHGDAPLFDFYLLFTAHDTLLHYEDQHYWEGAVRSTIDGILRRRASALVDTVASYVPFREPGA